MGDNDELTTVQRFYLEKLSPFVGGKIVGVCGSEANGNPDGYVGLVVRKPDGQKDFTIWFDQDAEGNGPGAPSIEEVPAGK
ncbi:MAG: hypothetical protein E3J64_02435 [Anaerolineales bacterium]|nr:MAG: hypothetical protein E3J64_02435 [Anaerolineales bacterium]